METLMKILGLLCLIGAINWGLVGFFNIDIVSAIFGQMSFISRTIYALIGCSAVLLIYLVIKQYKSTNFD